MWSVLSFPLICLAAQQSSASVHRKNGQTIELIRVAVSETRALNIRLRGTARGQFKNNSVLEDYLFITQDLYNTATDMARFPKAAS